MVINHLFIKKIGLQSKKNTRGKGICDACVHSFGLT